MTFIDSSAVNVALPSIQRDLQTDATNLQWVVEGYSLFLSALILIGGSLGDVFGRRRIFIAGIALFALASLACAGAQTILALNIARCVQGIGGALATPGSLALISANVGPANRGRAIGTWSGFASITAAIGPLLGGWLAQNASWRYVFIINVPLAVFVILAALWRVPESRDSNSRRIDGLGATLATLSLGLLTFGLITLQKGRPYTLSFMTIGCGVALLAAFIAWQMRAHSPMIPLTIFGNRTFSGANMYTFLLYAALGGGLFFVPIDLQNVQGYSPTAAGAAMLPFIAIMFVSSRWSGGLVATIGARIPLVAGALLAGFGCLIYSRIGIGGSYLTTFLPAAVVLGLGGALFVAPLTTTVMTAIDSDRAGIASGINNAVSRMAGLLAIAALGVVFLSIFYPTFERSTSRLTLAAQTRRMLTRDRATLATGITPPTVTGTDRGLIIKAVEEAYTAGFSRIMLLCAGLAWIAAAIAVFAIPGRATAVSGARHEAARRS